MATRDDIEDRMRTVEQRQLVHEAVCAERYKGIALRLNVIMCGIGLLLTAVAAGDPLVGVIKKMMGG